MSGRRFAGALGLLLVAYLALQCLYVARIPLVMDEYAGMREVDRLTRGLPYRDFRPYKTVLGYYLQLPARWVVPSPAGAPLAVKLWTATLVGLCLVVAAWRLGRRLPRDAVVLALAMTLACSTWLERSGALRVDALTGALGLLSLIAVLERRGVRGGVLVGLAFCVSQKAVYAGVAGGLALLVDRETRRALGGYMLGGAAVVAAYVAGWSAVAGGEAVLGAVFARPARIAAGAPYVDLAKYWVQTAVRNPAFYGVALLGLLPLWRRRSEPPAGALLVYSLTLLALCGHHRQPWPYFFVLLIPSLMVPLAVGLTALRERRGALVVVALAGVVAPLAWRLPAVLALDAGHQRAVVARAGAALAPGQTYLAGTPLLWDREQAHEGLAWLDRRRLAALERAPAGELLALLAALEEAPPRLLVMSYRLRRVPPVVQLWLHQRYAPTWSNIHGYAPQLTTARVDLAFEGRYRVDAPRAGMIRLDGRMLRHGEVLRLTRGRHRVNAPGGGRLRLELPGLDGPAPPERGLFVAPYDW